MEIKFIKFYNSETKEVNTLFVAEQEMKKDGQTFDFSSSEDMLAKSTTETLNFWNGKFVGTGQVADMAGLSA